MHPLFRHLPKSCTLGDLGRAFAAWHAERPPPVTPVTCRRGCSACCFQAAPLTPAEAFNLADLMRANPRLHQRALASRRRDLRSVRSDPHSTPHQRWLRERIPCPCLSDDGSCSIHPQRPLACRQHHVSSPAESCDSLDGIGVEVLPLDLDLRELLSVLCARLMQSAPQSIPLPYAIAWAHTHRRWRHRTWPHEAILLELAYSDAGYASNWRK
jgi:Fe-S-cluster containining protein